MAVLVLMLSTWSFIRACKGEITTVRAPTCSLDAIAGSWKHSDLPPPVGMTASTGSSASTAVVITSCRPSPDGVTGVLRNSENPK